MAKTTAAEKRHYGKVAQLGCIVCKNIGYEDSPAEIHHIRANAGAGQKSKDVIPLCHVHHRTGGYGLAFHAGKEAFEQVYGTELELSKQVEGLL
jgi:hypothetical protein